MTSWTYSLILLPILVYTCATWSKLLSDKGTMPLLFIQTISKLYHSEGTVCTRSSGPFLCSNLLYEMGRCFLDSRYDVTNSIPSSLRVH